MRVFRTLRTGAVSPLAWSYSGPACSRYPLERVLGKICSLKCQSAYSLGIVVEVRNFDHERAPVVLGGPLDICKPVAVRVEFV